MSADAHGTLARTSSKRRRAGTSGPLFIKENELADVHELINAHGILTSSYIIPGTLFH